MVMPPWLAAPGERRAAGWWLGAAGKPGCLGSVEREVMKHKLVHNARLFNTDESTMTCLDCF